MPPPGSSREAQVSCVYVVGVIGAAEYTTHYSVMLKVQEEEQPVVLTEGMPLVSELTENRP